MTSDLTTQIQMLWSHVKLTFQTYMYIRINAKCQGSWHYFCNLSFPNWTLSFLPSRIIFAQKSTMKITSPMPHIRSNHNSLRSIRSRRKKHKAKHQLEYRNNQSDNRCTITQNRPAQLFNANEQSLYKTLPNPRTTGFVFIGVRLIPILV